MIQMLAGLITSILLAIHCHDEHGEPVSIRRVRQLRNQILNESRAGCTESTMQGLPIANTQYHACKSLIGQYCLFWNCYRDVVVEQMGVGRHQFQVSVSVAFI